MAQLDKTFPTLDCAACILTPKMVDAAQNEKINICIPIAKWQSVKGFVGNFTVKIQQEGAVCQRDDLCTGCGLCTEKCPSRKSPRANSTWGWTTRRRDLYPVCAGGSEGTRLIDPKHCIKLKTGKCGVCSKSLHRRRDRL